MSNIMQSEKLLWNQLKMGNHQALAAIYDAHFDFLYRYGCKMVTDTATVEDTIQELFVELWQRRETIAPTDTIRPYLTVSLRRKLVRAINKVRKSTDVELDQNMFGLETAVDDLIIGKEISEEQQEKLTEALQHLSSRQKEILYMRYYAEMDYESICEAMEMNNQSARNLLSRALQKLGKVILLIILLIFFK